MSINHQLCTAPMHDDMHNIRTMHEAVDLCIFYQHPKVGKKQCFVVYIHALYNYCNDVGALVHYIAIIIHRIILCHLLYPQ